jgi:hypothetical protein
MKNACDLCGVEKRRGPRSMLCHTCAHGLFVLFKIYYEIEKLRMQIPLENQSILIDISVQIRRVERTDMAKAAVAVSTYKPVNKPLTPMYRR